MKKTHSRNKTDMLSSKHLSCPSNLNIKISSKKIEILFSRKTSTETLLSAIKSCENGVLSNTGKSLNKNIKRYLLELKDNLKQMNKAKKKKINYLEKEISKKKSDLIKKTNNNSKIKQIEKDNKKDIINKKDNINISNIKSELLLLNNLNFMAENYIEQIDNIAYKRTNEYNYLKLCMNYTSMEERETICNEQKYYPLISKILHKNIIDIRKKFKLVASAKQYQNDEIEDTNQNLIKLKNFISKKNKGYMDSKEVIQEESKEYTQSITLTKMANNNIYDNRQNEEIYNDNIIIVDYIDDESVNSNSLSGSLKNENCNKDININNNIQQLINVNMNINFNVNINKFFGNDKIIYNSDRINNNDIISKSKKTKNKKGLSSTRSLPNINLIREDIFEKLINNHAKNIVKGNKNKKYKYNYSKEILNNNYLITH